MYTNEDTCKHTRTHKATTKKSEGKEKKGKEKEKIRSIGSFSLDTFSIRYAVLLIFPLYLIWHGRCASFVFVVLVHFTVTGSLELILVQVFS